MPNKHYFLYDLTKFQSLVPGENNEVFLPINEPNGFIEAQLER